MLIWLLQAYLPLPVSSSARAHPLSFTLPLKRLQKHRSSTTSAAESDDSGHQQPGEPDRARFNQENSNLRSVACSDDAEPLYCPASEDDKSVSFVRWRSNTLLSMDDYEGVDLAAHQQHAFDSPRSWLNIRNQVHSGATIAAPWSHLLKCVTRAEACMLLPEVKAIDSDSQHTCRSS